MSSRPPTGYESWAGPPPPPEPPPVGVVVLARDPANDNHVLAVVPRPGAQLEALMINGEPITPMEPFMSGGFVTPWSLG